ncbi:MAG: hypothetical protein ONB27_14230 [candidate division KSB1 bacterium]|nr:hypothetical protein [candidate division KSB1 bacterium]
MNQRTRRTQQPKPEGKPRFPEKIQYIISPQEALQAMHQALENVKNFRQQEIHLFKTIIGPLVPDSLRNKIEKVHLDKYATSYTSLISGMGNLVSLLVLLGLDEVNDTIKDNYRLIILPYIEIKLRKKLEQLKRKKPFGWRIAQKFYERNIANIQRLVDNQVHLIAMAWTFCPAIGEPEMETGFYNRFVFTCNGGFIDLGHFFNCAVIAYLYGSDSATERAEDTEKQQAALRRKKWLTRMREKKYLLMITNLLWGYATSANTIEDRASDQLGINLGEAVRLKHRNGKMIDYFVELYLKLVRDQIKIFRRRSIFGKAMDNLNMFWKSLPYFFRKSATFDLEKYMQEFFDTYDAIDPHSAPELFQKTIEFYTEKYFSPDWEKYTCQEWAAVIPQDLYEHVVQKRPSFRPLAVPIKVQLKDTGQLVAPYSGVAET